MEKNSKTLSFEFFPPKTASGLEKLINIAQDFEAVPAEYFSVTFGAGGSTQQGTLDSHYVFHYLCLLYTSPSPRDS